MYKSFLHKHGIKNVLVFHLHSVLLVSVNTQQTESFACFPMSCFSWSRTMRRCIKLNIFQRLTGSTQDQCQFYNNRPIRRIWGRDIQCKYTSENICPHIPICPKPLYKNKSNKQMLLFPHITWRVLCPELSMCVKGYGRGRNVTLQSCTGGDWAQWEFCCVLISVWLSSTLPDVPSLASHLHNIWASARTFACSTLWPLLLL